MKQIYCDHSATTPVDQEVQKLMGEILRDNFGNPSSIHQSGQTAKAAVETARKQCASALNCSPGEIYFTGGGSESNNTVLKQILQPGDHFITTSIEHPSILIPAEDLAESNVEVTFVQPDSDGIIHPDSIAAEITNTTKLISVMVVNNELGTINPIEEIGSIAKSKNIIFHTDAVQAFGKIPLDLSILPIDFLSISAHKFYGPKGIGIIYIKKGNTMDPLISGGGQEKNIRAGTENVSGIAGMGLAAEIAVSKMTNTAQHLNEMTETFIAELQNTDIEFMVNGTNLVPGVLNITFPEVSGQNLMINLDLEGIAISYGAACASGTPKPPRVLLETGMAQKLAECSVRISFGKSNKIEDVQTIIHALKSIIPRLKKEPAIA